MAKLVWGDVIRQKWACFNLHLSTTFKRHIRATLEKRRTPSAGKQRRANYTICHATVEAASLLPKAQWMFLSQITATKGPGSLTFLRRYQEPSPDVGLCMLELSKTKGHDIVDASFGNGPTQTHLVETVIDLSLYV